MPTREESADAADSFAEDLEEDDESNGAATSVHEAPGAAIPEAESIRDELARVEDFVARARALPQDSKAASLVKAVRLVLDRPPGRRKVVIFTESLTTQDYLRRLLIEQTELRDDDITLFRGTNDSPRAMAALRAWREEHESERTPSPSVAVRLALVDEFRTRSTVMISSEAGAKGLNLQFCDTVVNYDLPWNPQRIEQRIGRCHRYGQQRDVTVINFIAKDNEAQRLTFDLLSTKLDLFGDVLDMSDVVLQTPRSNASEELVSALGPDFENQLRRIWDRARSVAEVEHELRRLGETMEERRQELERVRKRTVGLIESGLDDSVRDVFRRIEGDLPDALATLDAELQRVLCGYLDTADAAWDMGDRDGLQLLHIGASPRLPTPFSKGATVAFGNTPPSVGTDTLHLAHPLIKAAVDEARLSGSGAFRVCFELGPDAPPPLQARRGSRGRLALTRIAYRGFEREDRLCVTAVFEDAEVLRPADVALDLIRQPCTDIGPFETSLDVTAAHLDEVVNEEMFFDQSRASGADQASFDATMEQLDQYLADRALVLRRNRERQLKRLATAERARDAALGADNRARADARARQAEREVERLDDQLAELAARNDETYRRWKTHAHDRRYTVPKNTRLLTAEFMIA